MSKKDFLSQFTTNNKPDSFKEEVRIPVSRNKNTINPKLLLFGAISFVLIATLVMIIIFMPKIKVENFVGTSIEDVAAWLRQQGIETSGVIFKDEYNFDNEKNIIIRQDPESGKVTKKAKMTFIVSKGPDPDESIAVPDFKTMDKEAINNWIQENKLLSTKLNTTYSNEVDENGFIEAKYSGCDEDDFTRGCTLKISISKGPKPEDLVTMQDFVKKTYSEFEAWATSKKITIEKNENYSDTFELGIIISQSVKENEKLKVGDTVTVTVSKGKGIKVPDFSKMSKTEIDTWLEENASYCKVKKKYYDSEDYVISQSVKTGGYIGTDNKIQIEVNLGNTFYLDEIGFNFEGNSYDKFEDLTYALQDKGLYIDAHDTDEHSGEPRGTILGIGNIWYGEKSDEGNPSHLLSKVERLPLEVHIRCIVSDGKGFEFTFSGGTVEEFRNYLSQHSEYGFVLEVSGSLAETDTINTIKYDGTAIYPAASSENAFLPKGAHLIVE